jgi:HD-GYP domain-containing protein (c-di-GMP phosphodiesterase class II)
MRIDSYDSPDAEALLLVGEERLARTRRRARELVTSWTGAASFLTAATLLAVLAPWQRPLSIISLVLVLVGWVLVERVRFPVAHGWTYPTMLVFVPALFVLPTPVVPLVAVLAVLGQQVPSLIRKEIRPAMVPVFILDCWFALGPALVIVLAGAERFSWSHWPVYAAALLAQFAFDAGSTVTWSWIGEGITPRVQLPLLTWLYVVDLALAPLGLLIAAAAVQLPGLVLLALSPMGMLWLFARERQQRMDETLALSSAYRGTALLLGDVVEADDHYTGVHSRDVVELSIAVADQLGLDARQKRHVEFAALLHDVGKIRVPKEIINKPGALDAAEWQLMRRHTIDGEQMLEQVGGLLADVGHVVRASHEHYDGSGYPDGLAGETIPIEARIVCACDAYSAMTTDRSYRSAMSADEALGEMIRCAGTHFDPDVAAAIERLRRPEAPLPEPVVDEPKPQPWNVLGVPKLSPRPVGPSRPQPDCLSRPEPLPM